MLDPQEYTLESLEEIEEFLDMYTTDSYREAYSDYDFDMDNYGYDN